MSCTDFIGQTDILIAFLATDMQQEIPELGSARPSYARKSEFDPMAKSGSKRVAEGIYDLRYDKKGSRTGWKGRKPFRAVSHTKVGGYVARCFATLQEAKDWRRDQLEITDNWDNPKYRERREFAKLRDIKVRDVVFKHIHDQREIRKPGSSDDERISDWSDYDSLHKFGTTWLANMSLAMVRKTDAIRFFKAEMRDGNTYQRKDWSKPKELAATTIKRLRNKLQAIFKKAIDENWYDLCNLMKENPFADIKFDEWADYKKERVLMPKEEEALLEEFKNCQGLNKCYAPLAMYLVLSTGLRLQEVVNLLWSDVDFETRRIKIRKTKTDKFRRRRGGQEGFVTVLPYDAMEYLIELHWRIVNKRNLPGTELSTPDYIKNPVEFPDTHIFIDRYGKPLRSYGRKLVTA